jgi:acyl dehydratase
MNIPPVGTQSPPFSHAVELGAIRRFVEALGLKYQPYRNAEAARAAGYRDVVAPPTFMITLHGLPIPGLDLPEAGLIHGEQTFRYGESVVANDVITVVSRLTEVKTRGPLTFLTLETTGINQDHVMAFVSISTIITRESQS